MSVTIGETRSLPPMAVEWLDMLPPALAGDPWIQAIFNALAREMERVIGQAEAIAYGLTPATANVYTLPIWEALMGLPVNPSGTSVEVRRGLVLSRTLRGDGSGTQWEVQMSSASKNSYRYTENDSGDPLAPRYTLAINSALPSGVTIQALRDYVRSITPANLHVDIVGGNTYALVAAGSTDMADARNDYPNYDNMRYGSV